MGTRPTHQNKRFSPQIRTELLVMFVVAMFIVLGGIYLGEKYGDKPIERGTVSVTAVATRGEGIEAALEKELEKRGYEVTNLHDAAVQSHFGPIPDPFYITVELEPGNKRIAIINGIQVWKHQI